MTSYAYDAVGNLVKAKDENGLITEYVYDALEQTVKVSDSYSPWTCSRSSCTGGIPGNDRNRCRSSGCNVPDGETVIAGASGVQAIEDARRAEEIGKISQNANVADTDINLKPQNLMNELANSGVKYNPDEVVAVTKTKDGKLLWLENGNTKSGLTHIVERHADDFASQGINNIPQLLNSVLETTPVKMGSNPKGLFADYVFNGNTYRIAYGTNGYIVSFYPID